MKTRLILSAAIAVFVAQSLRAWDKPGHSVVAAVAFKVLEKTNPAVAQKAAAILKQSDDYASFNHWLLTISRSSLPPSNEKEPEMLFILAARWPDDIKSDGSRRDRSPHNTHPWHYINLPIGPNAGGHVARAPNIETAFVALRKSWGAATSDGERAPILCWFMHLVGDAHQPLHSSNFFSPTFPKGDAGGEAWAIRRASGATKLHAFWDNVLITGNDAALTARQVDAIADELLAKYPRTKFPQLAQNKDLSSWVRNETLPLALRYGYLDGKLAPPEPGAPTELSNAYKNDALEVSRRQVALAGYRLADFMVTLLAK